MTQTAVQVLDAARARRETPGCANVIHFNNAGAALLPEPVLRTMLAHLQREAAIGPYEAADEVERRIEQVYESLARLLSCSADEIAVMENATRAWDMAFHSIPFQRGDRILTGMNEYASNYIGFLQMARRSGVTVDVIPNDEHGQVSVEALRSRIDGRVKLIAITHVPTNGGLVNPAKEIGRVARQAGVMYLLDACQSVGQMPMDVNEIGCDMLSATARKFLRGPRGIGFLYVRRELIPKLEPLLLDLHSAVWVSRDRYEIRSDARRFENWEMNYSAKLGLGTAVDYAMEWGIEAIWQRVSALAAHVRTQLRQIAGVQVRDLGKVQCGIVSFTVEGKTAAQVKSALKANKINVSISPQEYTRLDMENRHLAEVVRASVHYYNDENEIARFCEVLKQL